MNRRIFLQSAAAAAAAPLRASLHPAQLGANTAIKDISLQASLDLLRQLKFPVVEIHPMGVPEGRPGQFPGFAFDRLSDTQKSGIRASLKSFQHVTAHLPYTGLDYFSKDPAIAKPAIQTVDTALEGSVFFGAEVMVLHPKPAEGLTLEQEWPVMIERIRRWGDMAQRHRGRIALETGFPPSIKDYVRLVKEVNHPAVGATIDVGHQSRYAELTAKVRPEARATPAGIRAYNETTFAIIEALGPKVMHFHVHDIDPATWREHLPLGTGFVDYPRLFRLLDKIGYTGYLIFEIGGPSAEMEHNLRDGKARLEALLSH